MSLTNRERGPSGAGDGGMMMNVFLLLKIEAYGDGEGDG
jgi:hypothetical protein